jgi:hypothetical protein
VTYDILYSLRGDQHVGRHLTTVKTEAAARRIVKNFDRFPVDTIHIMITCDDGRTIFDGSKEGYA